MDTQEIYNILTKLNFPYIVTSITQFCREEDGSPYDVWKIETDSVMAVLKKTSPEERTTLEAFFPHGYCGTPKIYGFAEYNGETYMLMEFFEGETMSHSTREKMILALDALVQMQEKFWGNTELADIGWTFEKRHTVRKKRLPYMEDLADAFSAYLEADRIVPRTLCNDDLLPFNVLVNTEQAVIIDWEFGGILPYPCALARLLAFGEEDTDFMFQMPLADKKFAVQYYYDNLIKSKGIPWEEYIRTMKLFFLKEYYLDYTIIPYEEKYRDDMIFMVLEAKDALGRVPRLNEDLLDVQKNYIDTGDMFWLAIDEYNRVIGCVGYNSIPGTTAVKLHRLYIKAARKHQGIGTRLLRTVELHLREQGKTAAHVHLGGKEYFESRSFYPKHGYKEYAPSMMKKELQQKSIGGSRNE